MVTPMNKSMLSLLFCLSASAVFANMSCSFAHEGAHGEASESRCLNPKEKGVDDSKYLAQSFVPMNSLSSRQRALLEDFFGKSLAQEDFDAFVAAHNDQAATFLALTNALAKTELDLGDGQSMKAIDMIQHISEIRGVRFISTVNLSEFTKWQQSGNKYIVHLVNHREETGNAKFEGHSQMGGGLHCGFDTQGFTHYTKPPYIHWNINDVTGNSDIHLDGFQPWYFGFIPNPEHLSYENSDVRSWLKEYEKKFGNPGFSAEKR
jgi:hypothetical protein